MALGKKAVVLVVAAAVAAGAGWGFVEWQKSREAKPSVAWGSVDAREVSLAFEGSGRIAELLREEGEAVKAGDVIGPRHACARDRAPPCRSAGRGA